LINLIIKQEVQEEVNEKDRYYYFSDQSSDTWLSTFLDPIIIKPIGLVKLQFYIVLIVVSLSNFVTCFAADLATSCLSHL